MRYLYHIFLDPFFIFYIVKSSKLWCERKDLHAKIGCSIKIKYSVNRLVFKIFIKIIFTCKIELNLMKGDLKFYLITAFTDNLMEKTKK